MSFRLRIMTMMAGALLVAFIGIAYCIVALFGAGSDFSRFVDRNLAEQQAYETMYAQGLQSGQALRNIILDYSNKQGHKNLAKAMEDFDQALQQAGQDSAGVQNKADLLKQLTDLRDKRKAIQAKVIAEAANDTAAAVKILNAEETPVWRDMKARLLDELEARKQANAETKAATVRQAERAAFVGVALAVISLIVAVVFTERLVGGLWRSLGGEPEAAKTLMDRVSSGDLTTHIDDAPAGSLLHNLDKMVSALRAMMLDIDRQAVQLAAGAEEISRMSAAIAQGSAQEADAASAMAATIEEFTVSAAHISDSAGETRSDSEHAVTLSKEGVNRVHQASGKIGQISATVTDTSTKIRALDVRAGQISTITGEIREIAGQTNLLALNAAIEAARAGEAGRGFAVVADEVGKLADRTSKATVEIEQMIGAIQSDTEAAVVSMEATLPEVVEGERLAVAAAESLAGIRDGAERTLKRVMEMADATNEQSGASTAIAQQVEEVARMVEETANNVQRSAQTASELENIARQLKGQVERFKV